MFTGIVEELVCVKAHQCLRDSARLMLAKGEWAEGLPVGDSVAVNGACLTVSACDGPEIALDVITETLKLTTLGDLRAGERVNVERAMAMGERFGGHIVSGHVDGVATLIRRREETGQTVMTFRIGKELAKQAIPKGSITLDGVSLTLTAVEQETVSVALIPTTLSSTTLGNRRPGDRVNVETDMIGKWVRKYLENMMGQEGLSLEKLKHHGFA